MKNALVEGLPFPSSRHYGAAGEADFLQFTSALSYILYAIIQGYVNRLCKK